ncbi:Alkaline phosphatase [hydrothermal vent metagenome]|uniref:Alkaline phosphatase n=1 Tax=hydrothermal vent metagenome TaxID=652676 RepID=A0A1W1C5Z7_9ZZZZ
MSLKDIANKIGQYELKLTGSTPLEVVYVKSDNLYTFASGFTDETFETLLKYLDKNDYPKFETTGNLPFKLERNYLNNFNDQLGRYALLALRPYVTELDENIYTTIPSADNYSAKFIADRKALYEDAFIFEQKFGGSLDEFTPQYIDLKYGIETDWGVFKNIVGFGGGNGATLEGSVFGDRLYGVGLADGNGLHAYDDIIKGGSGDDYIEGGMGADELHGGSGDDIIYANANIAKQYDTDNNFTDKLYGGSGDDTLYGSVGKDELKGGDDFDTYYAGDGDTIMDSDGKGVVSFEGSLLTGGTLVKGSSNKYKGDGGVYTLDNGVLTFTKGTQTLTINNYIQDNQDLRIKLNKDDKDPLPKDDDKNKNDDDKNKNNDSDKSNNFSSPLVLDLNANGKTSEFLYDTDTYFDMDGDKLKERTAWIESSDGLLTLDKNQNGIVDNGSELFGNYSKLRDGRDATDGFNALESYDSNSDGVIDSQDGVTDDGELQTLSELNIKDVIYKQRWNDLEIEEIEKIA